MSCLYVSWCAVSVQCLREPKEVITSPGCCEQYRCGESSPDLLEEQPVFLHHWAISSVSSFNITNATNVPGKFVFTLCFPSCFLGPVHSYYWRLLTLAAPHGTHLIRWNYSVCLPYFMVSYHNSSDTCAALLLSFLRWEIFKNNNSHLYKANPKCYSFQEPVYT